MIGFILQMLMFPDRDIGCIVTWGTDEVTEGGSVEGGTFHLLTKRKN